MPLHFHTVSLTLFVSASLLICFSYFLLDATFDVKSLIALRLSRYTRNENKPRVRKSEVKQTRTVKKLEVTLLDKVQLTQNRSMRRSRKRMKTKKRKKVRRKCVTSVSIFFFLYLLYISVCLVATFFCRLFSPFGFYKWKNFVGFFERGGAGLSVTVKNLFLRRYASALFKENVSVLSFTMLLHRLTFSFLSPSLFLHSETQVSELRTVAVIYDFHRFAFSCNFSQSILGTRKLDIPLLKKITMEPWIPASNVYKQKRLCNCLCIGH